jgi:DNA-binding XRE family transcriptional regulator/mRNA-degrading endonuclease RelE of RelBE toxin-antitoxin system
VGARKDAKRIMAKVERFAETGAGDVKALVGQPGKRLRVGDFRIIFDENETEIRVTRIGPRGGIYEQGATMKHSLVTTPAGEELVLISRADFEAMQDAMDAAAYARTADSLARGEQETLTPEEAAQAIDAPTPLAFWRAKRGVTQKALAEAAGITQGYVSDLESGRRKGEAAILKRMARRLRVRIDDLIVDDE